jgi:hypothetical protein
MLRTNYFLSLGLRISLWKRASVSMPSDSLPFCLPRYDNPLKTLSHQYLERAFQRRREQNEWQVANGNYLCSVVVITASVRNRCPLAIRSLSWECRWIIRIQISPSIFLTSSTWRSSKQKAPSNVHDLLTVWMQKLINAPVLCLLLGF